MYQRLSEDYSYASLMSISVPPNVLELLTPLVLSVTLCGVRDTLCVVRDTQCGVRDTQRVVRDTQRVVRDTVHVVGDTQCVVRGTQCVHTGRRRSLCTLSLPLVF